MNTQVLIAGGGMGGLAVALASARAGVSAELVEQAPAFGEVGAGIQLGPNAVRVLAGWGLSEALQAVAAFPERLRVRDAHDGSLLGELELGERAVRLYGQPYATIHRADAHRLLLQAVQAHGVPLHLNERVRGVSQDAQAVALHTEDGHTRTAQALVGCDGLWSRVRQHVLGGVSNPDIDGDLDPPPRFSGHLAYRGMVDAADVPAALKASAVTAWLGPRLHVVHYPVCAGRQFNVVAVVHGRQTDNPQSWTHEANRTDLLQALGPVHSALAAMIDAVSLWKLWPLNDRPPMTGAYGHARGRVALAGDAAHPMRPYLAQGAAMAIEDAWTLGELMARPQPTPGERDWAALFQRFAQVRWKRNARVQAGAVRNGQVFHAQGALRTARNLAMGLGGERLLDNAWLYSGPPRP